MGNTKKCRSFMDEILCKDMPLSGIEYYSDEIGSSVYFIKFYSRFLNYGVKKLSSLLEGKKSFKKRIYQDYSHCLACQLQRICLRTLLAELQSYKQNGKLIGKDIKEEYIYFCEEIVCKTEFIEWILEEYPVLRKCVEDRIKNLTLYYTEIILHFEKDCKSIQHTICKGVKVQNICKISSGFSDVHNNGRQVVKVLLDNGIEVLYKPRSMENEQNYQSLLKWMEEKTNISQKYYNIISYMDYSWSEIINYKTCNFKEMVHRYYERLGVQLFVTYMLGTKDLHYENLIASGEYPVLIELETLVSGNRKRGGVTVEEEIYYQLSRSVLSVGLLPTYRWKQNGNGFNSSGITGKGGQKYPFKVPIIVEEKTSKMRIDYDYPKSLCAKNLATVHGKYYAPLFCKDEILYGFTKAYLAALDRKDELERILGKLSGTRSRVLIADTQRYSMILSASYHPSLMKNEDNREKFVNLLWQGRDKEDWQIQQVVASESKSMIDGDIPYFFCYLNKNGLITAQGKQIEGYFKDIGMKALEYRLEKLGLCDLERQKELITLSLDLSIENQENCINRVNYVVKEGARQRESEKEQQIIKQLTEWLVSHVVWNSARTEVNWYQARFFSKDTLIWSIEPMGMYLYDGLAGMLLLMYSLSCKNNEDNMWKIYMSIKGMLYRYTEKCEESLEYLQSRNTGAYDGEASILYVYLLLYKRSGKKDYLVYAKKHAKILEKLIGDDRRFDLLVGNARAAQVLLLLYDLVLEKRYLDLAEYAIEILESKAEKQKRGVGWLVEANLPPMEGMAHGSSGIIIPVIALWKKTRKKKYLYLAQEIWEYENSLYDSQINNWNKTCNKYSDMYA